MAKEIKEVWYACYGSNIRAQRFLCYINGGTPPGAVRNFTGCSDKSRPKDSRPFKINREMYFAKNSVTWNGGGICFLKPEKDENADTLGRIYLINSGQFKDLVRQELKFEGTIEIDFDELMEKGSYNCMTNGRYGLLLYLGEIDGKPVVTFTSEKILKDEINQPNMAYLSTIVRGLREIYDLTNSEIKDYLRTKEGIKNADIKFESLITSA